MPDHSFRFELLARHHNRAAFSCGEPPLDEYLQKHARANASRNLAVVSVLVDPGRGRIVGYYSLANGSVEITDLPDDARRRLPRYPVPVTLLARLAVDMDYRGQGYGELLLMDALRTSLQASEQVGSYAVIVDAKHDAARAFYERYDFVPLPDNPFRLCLEMGYVRQLLNPEQT